MLKRVSDYCSLVLSSDMNVIAVNTETHTSLNWICIYLLHKESQENRKLIYLKRKSFYFKVNIEEPSKKILLFQCHAHVYVFLPKLKKNLSAHNELFSWATSCNHCLVIILPQKSEKSRKGRCAWASTQFLDGQSLLMYDLFGFDLAEIDCSWWFT